MSQTTCQDPRSQRKTKTGVEKHVKAVTELDHAVVLEKIAAESAIDPDLKHLKQAIKTGTWDKKYPILKPYADLQAEIYEAEDVILRLNKIIPPEKLREKIIRIAHNARLPRQQATQNLLK